MPVRVERLEKRRRRDLDRGNIADLALPTPAVLLLGELTGTVGGERRLQPGQQHHGDGGRCDSLDRFHLSSPNL